MPKYVSLKVFHCQWLLLMNWWSNSIIWKMIIQNEFNQFCFSPFFLFGIIFRKIIARNKCRSLKTTPLMKGKADAEKNCIYSSAFFCFSLNGLESLGALKQKNWCCWPLSFPSSSFDLIVLNELCGQSVSWLEVGSEFNESCTTTTTKKTV